MRHAMRLLPAAILTVAVWIMPMSAHAQFGRVYTTTITSPAAGAVIVTPTGQITVTGKNDVHGHFWRQCNKCTSIVVRSYRQIVLPRPS